MAVVLDIPANPFHAGDPTNWATKINIALQALSDGVNSALSASGSTKAPIDSPSFTGTVQVNGVTLDNRVADDVNTTLLAGTGITLAYNATTHKLILSATGGGGGGTGGSILDTGDPVGTSSWSSLKTASLLNAESIPIDTSTSGVDGDDNMPQLQEAYVGPALIEVYQYCVRYALKTRGDAMEDASRLFDARMGAAPTTTQDGTSYGYVPAGGVTLTGPGRQADTSWFGTGTRDNTTVLYGDGVFRAPPVVGGAARTAVWLPSDNNMVGASDAPSQFTLGSVSSLVASTSYVARMFVRGGVAITNFCFHCQTAGATAAAGWFGVLYGPDGSIITNSQSADMYTSWNASGAIVTSLGAAYTPSADGFVYVMLRTGSAGTMPKIAQGAAIALSNIGCASPSSAAANIPGSGGTVAPRYAVAASATWSGTTPPSALGTITQANAIAMFMGLS